MPTSLDAADRRALRDRAARLTPETPRQWGTLTAPRMVCHLLDAMAMCYGDLPCKRAFAPTRLLGKLIKPMVLAKPWPRGKIKGPPEIFSTPPAGWYADLERLDASLERFAAPPANSPPHPFFGRLSVEEWGRLMWKERDH